MTSFGNSNIDLFLKFFYVGLMFGLIMIVFDLVCKIFKRNVYVFNLAWFVFFLAFGFVFSCMSLNLFNFSFCWFGLFGMILGTFLVKISIKFLFDNLIRLIYNIIIKVGDKKRYGKLQQDQKS